MNLRTQAAADLQNIILGDSAAGFGWPITITDPNGVTGNLTGYSNDISMMIDPETGAAVTGRNAFVVVSISALTAAGLDIPKAAADENQRPWSVAFNDIAGRAQTFEVLEGMPDRTIGAVICRLGFYRK